MATQRTLENYLAVALLEAEYWGTDVNDPLWNPEEEPIHTLVLIYPDHDAMYAELQQQYGIKAPSDYEAGHPNRWQVYADLWLLIAADLEQRIAAVNGSY